MEDLKTPSIIGPSQTNKIAVMPLFNYSVSVLKPFLVAFIVIEKIGSFYDPFFLFLLVFFAPSHFNCFNLYNSFLICLKK